MRRHFSPGQLEEALAVLPEPLRILITESEVPAGADAGATTSATEDRIARLEDQVASLAEAVRTLTRGLAEVPGSEPVEHRAAKPARLTHEMLLAAKD